MCREITQASSREIRYRVGACVFHHLHGEKIVVDTLVDGVEFYSQVIAVTEQGKELCHLAARVPFEVGSCVKLNAEEAKELHTLLYRLLAGMEDEHGAES